MSTMRRLSVALVASLLAVGGSTTESSSDNLIQSRDLQTAADIEAEAYRCDENNDEIKSGRPLEGGERVRICVETSRTTKLNDIYLLKINTFKFYKKEAERTIRQDAIDAGSAAEGGQTNLDCTPGSSICSFGTRLRDVFFESDGTVEGIGSIAMQDGQRRQLVLRGGGSADGRRTQDFVGLTGVRVEFDVEDGFDKNKLKEARYSFREHWNEAPAHMQGLYVSGCLLLLLLLCCVCAGLILWRQCCADVPGRWSLRAKEEEDPDVQFYVHKGGEDDDHSETYSVDDDLFDSEDEDDDDDDDEEQEQAPPRRRSQQRSSRKMLNEETDDYDDYDDEFTNASTSRASTSRTGNTTVQSGDAIVLFDDSSSRRSKRSSKKR